jgi:hypothetical protein
MANAQRDENRVPTLTAVSTLSGDTPVNVTANPQTGAVQVEALQVLVSSAQFASISASASGATELVAAVERSKIRVVSYDLLVEGAVSVKFQSDSTDLTGAMPFAQNGGKISGFSPVGHFETDEEEPLNIHLSGNVAVAGHLTYIAI